MTRPGDGHVAVEVSEYREGGDIRVEVEGLHPWVVWINEGSKQDLGAQNQHWQPAYPALPQKLLFAHRLHIH